MICRCIAGAARPTGASGTNATTIIKSSLGQWDLQSMIHTCPYQAAWRTRRRLLAGSRLLLSVGSLELCTNCGCDTNVSHYLHARQAAVLFWQKRRWSVRFLQLGGSRAPDIPATILASTLKDDELLRGTVLRGRRSGK